jgi:predicted MFS family arabinose efflux permease
MLALDSLNLWIADVQGLGGLAAVFLHSKGDGGMGWSLSQTGYVMTVMGLSNVLASPFAGGIIDSSHFKREIMASMLVVTGATYFVLWKYSAQYVVAAALIMQALVSAAYGPGVNSLSVGLVGQAQFSARCARNEIAKHFGGIISAVLPIILIHRWGYHPYFLSIGGMTCLACLSAVAIKADDIDHLQACGSALADADGQEESKGDKASGVRGAVRAASPRGSGSGTVPIQAALLRGTVMLFCVAVFCFHLANGAMLPTLGQRIDELSTHNATRVYDPVFGTKIDGPVGVSLSTIVAQVVMIPTALAAKVAASAPGWGGRKRTLMVGFLILPIRGAVFASSTNIWVLLAAQSMDGLGAGIFGVVAPTIMADLARGTGRFSLMQGVLCTVVGLGASLSGGLTGFAAQTWGFATAFLMLACIAIVATFLLALMRETGAGGQLGPQLVAGGGSGTKVAVDLQVAVAVHHAGGGEDSEVTTPLLRSF